MHDSRLEGERPANIATDEARSIRGLMRAQLNIGNTRNASERCAMATHGGNPAQAGS